MIKRPHNFSYKKSLSLKLQEKVMLYFTDCNKGYPGYRLEKIFESEIIHAQCYSLFLKTAINLYDSHFLQILCTFDDNFMHSFVRQNNRKASCYFAVVAIIKSHINLFAKSNFRFVFCFSHS